MQGLVGDLRAAADAARSAITGERMRVLYVLSERALCGAVVCPAHLSLLNHCQMARWARPFRQQVPALLQTCKCCAASLGLRAQRVDSQIGASSILHEPALCRLLLDGSAEA